jgi:hypothetical protein
MKKIVASLLIASIASMTIGCASTPANPVLLAQVGDETKTCDAITNEMQQMINAQTTAASDKNSQVGGNVALGVSGIFLLGIPWFFMDLGGSASVELKAAQARFQRLQQMAADKKCPNVPVMKPDVPVEGDPNTPEKITEKDGVTKSVQPLAPASAAAYPSTNPKINDLPNPAKRIEDLNTLRQKGLITQQEYEVKRAEILKNL